LVEKSARAEVVACAGEPEAPAAVVDGRAWLVASSLTIFMMAVNMVDFVQQRT